VAANAVTILEKLGPFYSDKESLKEPIRKIVCIKDWEELYHRYKPQNIPYL
jgi:hypothetical protein